MKNFSFLCNTSVPLSLWDFLLQLSSSLGAGITSSIGYLASVLVLESWMYILLFIAGLWSEPVRCARVHPVPGAEARGEMCLSSQADLREVQAEAEVQECHSECLQENYLSSQSLLTWPFNLHPPPPLDQ